MLINTYFSNPAIAIIPRFYSFNTSQNLPGIFILWYFGNTLPDAAAFKVAFKTTCPSHKPCLILNSLYELYAPDFYLYLNK